MNLLREPLIWFLVIAFSSLVITLILFRVIKSSARIGSRDTHFVAATSKARRNIQASKIKTNNYLLTGGVAGSFSFSSSRGISLRPY